METATAPTAPSAAEASTQSKTIADLLPMAAERHADLRAVTYKDESGQWVSKTYREVGEIARKLSLGLIELGVEKGDKVSILANTRPEWTYFDFAALSAGATVVPIYQTNSPDECQYVLENSDAKVVIVEDDEQLAKVQEVRDRCSEARAGDPDGGLGRRRDLDGRADRERLGALGLRVGAALALGHPRRHLHLHLHLGHHRAAEGLRDLPRQLPLDGDDGAERERPREGVDQLSLPPPRPLLRAPDPVPQLRPRRQHRLLGARPAEDRPQPRPRCGRSTSRRSRGSSRRSTRRRPATSRRPAG